MVDLNLGYTRMIIAECEAQGLLRNQTAYVLATAYWETARTMQPIREKGGEAYLRKKKYYPYVGMGFVQLTWKENYIRAGAELGVDFVRFPKKLLEPRYATPILVTGMREGWFTGKKLSDYITLQKSDFKGARRIINGTDKAKEIADIAAQYDGALKQIGYAQEPAAGIAPKPSDRKPSEPEQPVADTTPIAAPKSLLAILVDLISKLFGRRA